eukprot:TRINITY_DN9349_c0_g1_i1.p1 TRINITY_DN9349_c0_g1~~TRINITY_DN9349_c0_g1_i1.p1  ORF type:complete len:1048 (-),score=167.71 TRINITY_DN9349_c0_g1_i1:529-3672(-)
MATLALEASAVASMGYGYMAFNYNMGRFEFDAGQDQTREHQNQNLKIALWKLYREDINDLFSMTTDKTSTYMTVGTIFLGLTVGFIMYAVDSWPFTPKWLIFFWNIHVYASTAHAALGLWLIMHGSAAAGTACVKVLTEAVRPHIPTKEELDAVCYSLARYEKTGPLAFLQIPAFLKYMANETPDAPDRQREAEALMMASSTARVEQSRLLEILAKSKLGLNDSALSCEHIKLFRQIQMSYASFEGYSRVCLLLSTHHLMFVAGYYCMTHYMVQEDYQPVLAWFIILAFVFASHLLFRLDLFVGNTRLRIIRWLVSLGPICATLAANLWAWNSRYIQQFHVIAFSEHLPKLFALIGLVFSAILELWILCESIPNNSIAQLPGSYRSVRYIDLFGWWDKNVLDAREEGDSLAGAAKIAREALGARPSASSCRTTEASIADSLREAESLQETLQRLLQPELAKHLAAEEQVGIEDLHDVLTCATSGFLKPLSRSREQQQRMCHGETPRWEQRQMSEQRRPRSLRVAWLKLQMTLASGDRTSYYINTETGEISWNAPREGAMDMDTIKSAAIFLEKRLNVAPSQADPSLGVPYRPATERNAAAPVEEEQCIWAPIETIAPRPGARFDARTMPWRYFRKVSLSTLLCWAIAFIWVCFLDMSHSRLKLPHGQLVESEWPHSVFEPVAIACAGNSVLLADSEFDVQVGELPEGLWGKSKQARRELEKMELTAILNSVDRPEQWRAMAAVGEGAPEAILLLSEDGHKIMRYEQRWKKGKIFTIGPDLDITLHGIAAMPEEEAEEQCAAKTWGAYAATDSGEVLVMCAYGDHLTPVVSLADSPRKLDKVRLTSILTDLIGPDEFLGLHVEASGALWLLARISDGSQTELRLWDANGKLRGDWRLPPLPEWARGFCLFGEGENERRFLFASFGRINGPTARPQLWQFDLNVERLGLGAKRRPVQGFLWMLKRRARRVVVGALVATLAVAWYLKRRRGQGALFSGGTGRLATLKAQPLQPVSKGALSATKASSAKHLARKAMAVEQAAARASSSRGL